jgi:hypothetical protein
VIAFLKCCGAFRPDATLDDVLEEVAVPSEIQRAIAELDARKDLSHADVKSRFDEPLAARVPRPPLEQGPFENWPDITFREEQQRS